MALNQAQAARVEQIIGEYELASPSVSLADFMLEIGEGELLTALEETIRDSGDAGAYETLHAVPSTPESEWRKSVEEFDAPTEGGPWALNKSGRWFTVTKQAPGGKVFEADGRTLYMPPQHESVRVSEYGGYGGRTDNELRWTDQKFRMARAALLSSKPFHNLFFRVAPRGGGPMGVGRAFQSEGIHYDSEGGELYPDLKPSDPAARTLNEWWRLQDFGGAYTGGYEWGQALNWLRVYTGADGYRHYKAWSDSEMREYMDRWHLAAPGRVCTPKELNRYYSDGVNLQRERQAAQTEGDYSLHWAWPIGPLSMCQESSAARLADNLRKAAIIAAIVVTAIHAPQIAAKLKAFMTKIGPKIAGAATSAGSSIGTALLQGKDGDEAAAAGIQQILTDPATQQAIADGELPPPPTSTADPSWATYAQVAAEWYMSRQLAEQRQSLTTSTARDQAAASDLAWMQNNEAALRAELNRARTEIERLAAGEVDPDEAAANFAAGDDKSMLALLGLGAVALLAIGRM